MDNAPKSTSLTPLIPHSRPLISADAVYCSVQKHKETSRNRPRLSRRLRRTDLDSIRPGIAKSHYANLTSNITPPGSIENGSHDHLPDFSDSLIMNS